MSVSENLFPEVEAYRDFVNPRRVETLEAGSLPLLYGKASGSWLEDMSGGRFLDLVCGYGTALIGHRHAAVVDSVYQAVAGNLPFNYPVGISTLAGKLGKKLCQLAGRNLNKVYFGNSGAEGIEAALKFAMARTGRSRFLGFSNAFHGFTLGALSLCGSRKLKGQFSAGGVDALEVPFGDIEAVENRLKSGLIAGVVAEPVQGMAGARSWSKKKLEELSGICRRYGTVLILDEVLTGLGRTGKWFAFQHATEKLAPDIVVVSKGLTGGMFPTCAVLMTDEIFNAVYADAGRAGIHSSTFEGNLVAMNIGYAVIGVIEDNCLLKRSRSLGRLIKSRLEEIKEQNIGITNVRGSGLLIAFEVDNGLFKEQPLWGAAGLRENLLKHGIITQLAMQAPSYISLLPPLTISDSEIDLFFSRLHKVLH